MVSKPPAANVPRYSVIVPAHNAADTLGACLAALRDQSLPIGAYEVIVVDDGSTDHTAAVAGQFPVVLLQQAHAGPAAARNLGARAARGQYLLFTDADCAPARDWIAEIVRPLEEDPAVAAAKGACRTAQSNLIARFSQAELEVKYAHLRGQRSIDFVDTYAAAFRRDAFWQAGGFDPTFPAASNEDTQLSFDLASRGWRLVFTERAVVQHQQPASLWRYLQRKWRHGRWRVPVYRHHPKKVAGDSYTPRSTQVQFACAILSLVMLPVAELRGFALAGLVTFALATVPFVRQATHFGWKVALTAPFILYLRALALAGGLACGCAATAWAFLTSQRPWRRRQRPAAGSAERMRVP